MQTWKSVYPVKRRPHLDITRSARKLASALQIIVAKEAQPWGLVDGGANCAKSYGLTMRLLQPIEENGTRDD